ncbi:MAG: carboxypeptidase-like regulatory domain-containing protein [Prevotella sp.]|jgi:hypothetical protein|nr:carboxypeptidase-like regulatory domain-containing protein [Prevotella sp.]
MKFKSYNILFRVFSYLSDRTNGAPFFVKYKLLLGTLIIGLTNNISTQAQKKEVVNDTTNLKQPITTEITCYKPAIYAQNKTDSITIRGNVKDSIGDAIAGIYIYKKNKPKGTATNLDGHFTLKARFDDILVFSMVGFHTQEIPVSEIKNNITVIMKENNVNLSCYITIVADEPPVKRQILPIVNVTTEVSINSTLKPESLLKFPELNLSESLAGIMCYGIVVNPYHNDDIYTPRYRAHKFYYSQISEKPVSPIGHLPDFQKWVQENVQNKKKSKGEITVSFVINKKGKLVDRNIIKGISKEIDKEVLNTLARSKKWKPGKLYNKAVETIIEFTIKFDDK